MGQHGSARLSVHSRLTIALRVQEQGWTVTAAARAAARSWQEVLRSIASKGERVFAAGAQPEERSQRPGSRSEGVSRLRAANP